MKQNSKRIVSILILIALLFSLLPVTFVQASDYGIAPTEDVDAGVLNAEAYVEADSIFAQIDEMESAPAKKNSTDSQLSEAAEAIVRAADGYVSGSIVRNGDSFTWEMENGICCIYSPRMRKIESEMQTPDEPAQDGAFNEPVAIKGGWPAGNQVYLIGPYYGYDSDFTNQYKNEATAIAKAIGDTDGYTLYSGKAATVDAVADAVSNGAVVIFDSHGDTDYASGYDYVSGANNSFLCLTSTTGLTSEDYADGARYYSSGIYINGATIANHMTSDSPGGILWMAICLGMATDTFSTPLRDRGVEVVCGYSQSVTFAGDYLFEETFWDEMCVGSTVAEASAAMKSKWGEWDWSTKIASYYGYSDGYSSINEARSDYVAFPVVVSDEDVHPGQRNGKSFYGADSLQTVRSTYTLFAQHTVSATVNNSAYGTVSVNGSTVTVVPAEGYFAQSCTLVSGSATITQNGNTFQISASSDCTVQVNFAPKTAVSVSFSGAAVSPMTVYAGDSMTLPAAIAPDGFTFIGWMDEPLTEDTTEVPDFYSTTYTPTGNTVLYALYSFVDANSGTGTGDYVKVTSARSDWSGEYLIVYEADGLILDSTMTTYDKQYNYQSVTIIDNTIKASEGDPYKFTIAPESNGYSIQGMSGKYIGALSNANSMNTDSVAMKNTISLDASGNANIIGSGGAYLRYNVSAARFRYYKTSSYSGQKPVALYLKDGSAGTLYYTGNTAICDHVDTQTVAAKPAGCLDMGYTQGVYCNDCQSYIEGHETVQPLGHTYSKTVFAPTATEQGYTLYICTTCGDQYKGDFVEALGQMYTVSFVVPSGVTFIADMDCNRTGITLPQADVPTYAVGYQFAGWATGQIDNVTQIPQLYTGHFVATENLTLYAVYTYTVEGGGSSEYVRKELSEISSSDEVVITVDYEGTVYAMNSINGADDAPDGIIVNVITENGITKLENDPDETLLWNISGREGSYKIHPNGRTDQWLYCISTNNGVRVGTGSANTFSIDSGYLYNNDQSRYLGVYRTNPDWRCYTSINSNIVDETLGFYVRGEGKTTYYTTVVEGECDEHTATISYVNGANVITCSACGKTVSITADQFKINGAYLTLSSDISVICRVTVPAGFENAYVVLEVNGVKYTATSFGKDAGNKNLFSYPGINPQMMGDNICATVYATVDGMEVSYTHANYSVLQYCNRQFELGADSKLKALISDLLVYGAASQKQVGYKTDALVTDLFNYDLEASTFPGVSSVTDKQKVEGSKTANDVVSASLNLSNQVVLKLGFQFTDTDLSKYTIKVTVGDKVCTYNAATCYADGGRYYLNFSDYSSTQFDDTVTVCVMEGDTVVSRTLTYSVNTYIAKNAGADTDFARLLQAVYNYGVSAKNYVA